VRSHRFPLLGCWACLLGILPLAGEEPPAVEKTPAQDEQATLKRFFKSYSGATDQPLLRADAVLMLKGLKSPEALRVLTGLLADSATEVRRNACRLMAEASDPRAYFVKPLTGALRDPEAPVRLAAAEAMSAARVKSRAVKALVITLDEAVQTVPLDPSFVGGLHKALVRLTGNRPAEEASPKELAALWMEWRKQNQEALEAADRKYLEQLQASEAGPRVKAEAPLPAEEPSPPAKDFPGGR
jgi:hypothetical protein